MISQSNGWINGKMRNGFGHTRKRNRYQEDGNVFVYHEDRDRVNS